MKEEKELHIRSDAVQEIIGRPPNWLVQWGTLLIFFITILLGWISFFLEYPEFVSGEILVQSTNPAKSVVVAKEKRINELFFASEDTVEAGSVVVVFDNQARFQDILNLDATMSSIGPLTDSSLLAFKPGRDFYLGNIQSDFLDFLYKQEALARLSGNKSESGTDPGALRRNATSVEGEIRRLRIQVDEINKQLYEATDAMQKRNLDDRKQILLNDLEGKQFMLEKLNLEITGGRKINGSAINTASKQLKESFIRLQNKLEDWKQNNLILTPFRSIVKYNSQKIRKGQLVRANQEILQFIPLQPESLTARMLLELGQASKVKQGQEVLIKMDNYDSPSFGWLKGRIIWKGGIPVDNMIPVEIYFPDGKISSTGISLDMGMEMTGKAQIIVARKRIIERVFESFR